MHGHWSGQQLWKKSNISGQWRVIVQSRGSHVHYSSRGGMAIPPCQVFLPGLWRSHSRFWTQSLYRRERWTHLLHCLRWRFVQCQRWTGCGSGIFAIWQRRATSLFSSWFIQYRVQTGLQHRQCCPYDLPVMGYVNVFLVNHLQKL